METDKTLQSSCKVLVIGGDGMLGHQLVRTLSPYFYVKASIRDKTAAAEYEDLLNRENTFFDVDVRSKAIVTKILNQFRPDVVVNAAGVIKQRPEGNAAIPCIEVNALFPHQLHQILSEYGGRLIHISTDCVFSGHKGNYTEKDVADATDIYGRSKLLGEVTKNNALTLRTSMIGSELKYKSSLLEWFMRQRGVVPGYTKAIFSGLTTIELARIIQRIISEYPLETGLYHISSQPISKYELLCLIKEKIGHDVEVVPDDNVIIDRSLNSKLFQSVFDYRPPSWQTMIDELAKANLESS